MELIYTKTGRFFNMSNMLVAEPSFTVITRPGVSVIPRPERSPEIVLEVSRGVKIAWMGTFSGRKDPVLLGDIEIPIASQFEAVKDSDAFKELDEDKQEKLKRRMRRVKRAFKDSSEAAVPAAAVLASPAGRQQMSPDVIASVQATGNSTIDEYISWMKSGVFAESESDALSLEELAENIDDKSFDAVSRMLARSFNIAIGLENDDDDGTVINEDSGDYAAGETAEGQIEDAAPTAPVASI